MTFFRPRTRPAAMLGMLAGTAASISLAGLVWAQAPAENWPFDEHTQAETAPQPQPPKSPVQKRLEELYKRDGRPLPDYMQQEASSQAAPVSTPGNQHGPADSQGNVHQQLSNYYQSQGRTIPAQPNADGSQSSSPRKVQRQTASAAPAKPGFFERLNPFRRKPPANASTQPHSQTQKSATAVVAASDAHTEPEPPQPIAIPCPQSSSPAASAAPAAKSSSFWGDFSLRGASKPAAQPPAAITVDLGPGARLVPKTRTPAQVAKSAPKVSVDKDADVFVHSSPVAPAVVAIPTVVAVPAEQHESPTVAQEVKAANAVVADDMPFKESSEEADQPSGNQPSSTQPSSPEPDHSSSNEPYSGLTLEDEQSELSPPGAKTPPVLPAPPLVPAAPVTSGTHLPASDQQPKTVQHSAPAKASQPHKPHPLADSTEPTARTETQHSAPKSTQHESQSAAKKVHSIGERVGQRGLKGFCPVVLRDQRELVDAKTAYCSIYRGKIYCFSSPDAQARFDAAPRKYAPVAGGIDVVVKANSDQAVEGMLDFALWYQDRLYLFCSPESVQAFSLDPAAYAAAAQRIE
jgi:YHS domain-containing protein